MTASTDSDLQPAVAAEYLALADLLEPLPVERWDTPSLCAGWRVREVVAHLTMPARYSVAEFESELRQSNGDFTDLSNRVAARDAALPTATLLDNLRSEVMSQWVPPGGGYAAALNHVVIHGLDVTVPLGADRVSPERPSTCTRSRASPEVLPMFRLARAQIKCANFFRSNCRRSARVRWSASCTKSAARKERKSRSLGDC